MGLPGKKECKDCRDANSHRSWADIALPHADVHAVLRYSRHTQIDASTIIKYIFRAYLRIFECFWELVPQRQRHRLIQFQSHLYVCLV